MAKKSKKLKSAKSVPEGTILIDMEFWEKVSKQECKDGACELKKK